MCFHAWMFKIYNYFTLLQHLSSQSFGNILTGKCSWIHTFCWSWNNISAWKCSPNPTPKTSQNVSLKSERNNMWITLIQTHPSLVVSLNLTVNLSLKSDWLFGMLYLVKPCSLFLVPRLKPFLWNHCLLSIYFECPVIFLSQWFPL